MYSNQFIRDTYGNRTLDPNEHKINLTSSLNFSKYW